MIGLLDGNGLEEVVFIAPVVGGQDRGHGWSWLCGLGFEEGNVFIGRIGGKGIDGAVAVVGDDDEVAGFVEG